LNSIAVDEKIQIGMSDNLENGMRSRRLPCHDVLVEWYVDIFVDVDVLREEVMLGEAWVVEGQKKLCLPPPSHFPK
jgi:hypothetical protein